MTILSAFLKLLLAINLLQIAVFGFSILFDNIEEARRNTQYEKAFNQLKKHEEEKKKK
jgi:hypothetical protein